MPRIKWSLISFGLATALSPSNAAMAQGISDNEDIIVTARRLEERIQDVPISITVFNQEELENRNVVNAQDLAIYTPSLSANSNYGSEGSSFAIRGFVQDPGTAPSVGVYFADVVSPRGSGLGGIPSGDGAGPGSFFDLQNVQVLKGPQGTLFGRNTTGGAILFTPRKPSHEMGGYAELSLGNYDMRRLQAAINVPLNDDFRVRLAADHHERDGYLKNNSGIGPRRMENVNYTALRASVVADLTPDLENYTIASYLRSNTRGSIHKVIGCNPTNSPYNFVGLLACAQLAEQKDTDFYTLQNNEPDPRSKLTQWQIVNTTTWMASDTLTVKNIVSYAQLEHLRRTPIYGTDLKLGPLTLPFVAIAPAPGLLTTDQSTFTEELQLQGSSANDSLNYQVGGYYEESKPLGAVGNRSAILASCSDIAALKCIAPLPGGSAINEIISRTSYRSMGLYAQASYNLTEKLKATAGFRYTWDRSHNSISRRTYVFPNGVAEPVCTDAQSTLPDCFERMAQNSKAPTWLLGLDYKPSDDLLLYAKYTRGYRSGGIFPSAPSDYRLFNPEKVESYEVGTKMAFRGDVSGNFDASLFYNDFSNQQLLVPFNPALNVPVSPTQGVVNAGASKIYGAEVSAGLKLLAGLSLSASYTYLHAEIRNIAPLASTDPNYVVNFQISSGQELVLSPKHKLTLSGQYEHTLPSNMGTMSLGATYVYTSRQLNSYAYNDPIMLQAFGGNLARMPGRGLVNLHAGWSDIGGSSFDLSMFVSNLTNKKYYAFVPGVAAAGFETAVLGEPRMIGVRLRYNFGEQ